MNYQVAATLSAFGFFSKTWMFGSSRIKPFSVASPIFPAIAPTHSGKFAWASVSFFQTLGLTVTLIICPSQSIWKCCQPFSTAVAVGSSVILIVISRLALDHKSS
ncbi:hypothetical protein PI95_031065 [Hassallia byssoidea VB512170]|uniref:Uncharacterized protein n=1 Tax=Hassallia byssoidea VB512170 TaxID=1304833 RepID=A0A846HLB6_9CYAN|nr:hypothetical protein [Hassalia byssoidea]NEU76831.1 hypothetical protein [Hassalia byssoidea VB512170]